MQELERDLILLSDQNEMLNKSLQEKDICLVQLEKSYNEFRLQFNNQDLTQRMATPVFGDQYQQSAKMFKLRNKSADIIYPQEG